MTTAIDHLKASYRSALTEGNTVLADAIKQVLASMGVDPDET